MQNRVVCRAMVEWLKQLAYALSLRFKSRVRLDSSLGQLDLSQFTYSIHSCSKQTHDSLGERGFLHPV